MRAQPVRGTGEHNHLVADINSPNKKAVARKGGGFFVRLISRNAPLQDGKFKTLVSSKPPSVQLAARAAPYDKYPAITSPL